VSAIIDEGSQVSLWEADSATALKSHLL
jgi:hypothetical protein